MSILRRVAELRPHPRNYNEHGEQQIADLAASLAQFGQRKPVVVAGDMLVAGEGLWRAAQTLGWAEIETAPVPEEWDEARVLAYMAADNELARQADPDLAQLAALVAELGDVDGELARLAAGGEAALQELLANIVTEPVGEDPGPQIDKAAELQVKWGTATGQLWELGEHRLICGDCTDAAIVARVMGGEKAEMVFTDPPYGVDYDGGTKRRERLKGDSTTDLYGPACEMAFKHSDEKASLYLWHAGIKGIAAAAAAAAAAAGYEIRCEIVWNKNQAQYGALSAQYKQKHEPAYYCFKRGKAPRWFGPTNEVTVWDINRSSVNEFHPTQKPPELAERAMRNSSERGDIVIDLFLGGGCTLIACERLGRRCRACEIEPKYCAVALERWATMTGQTPVRME